MSNTPYQPALPAEQQPTVAELNFMEESPPGLFPENQDSNFGFLIRKLWADRLQVAVDQLETIFNERFVSTSTQFLDEWEKMVGLPQNPGKTDAERRSRISSRLIQQPFTKGRVRAVIEDFITATFGNSAAFTPQGLALTSAGIPLYSGASSLLGTYRVYYDPQAYSYEVWILNSITVDVQALQRELARITPAGEAFTIDNTQTDVLHYRRTVRNKQPIAYYRLGGDGGTDLSGLTNDATVVGTPVVLAAPGLLNSAVAGTQPGASAYTFDGIDDNLSAPNHALQSGMRNISVEAWIRPMTNFPTTGNAEIIATKGSVYQFRVEATGTLTFFTFNTAVSLFAGRATAALSLGTLYHVVAVKRGSTIEIYVNGVRADLNNAGTTAPVPETIVADTSPLRIGSINGTQWFWKGDMDEVAVYNYALSPDQILENYRTGINVQQLY